MNAHLAYHDWFRPIKLRKVSKSKKALCYVIKQVSEKKVKQNGLKCHQIEPIAGQLSLLSQS
jgi:hypothetical protein